jgi:hypothetical protein
MHGGTIDGPVAIQRGSTLLLDQSAVLDSGLGVGVDSQAYISGGRVRRGVTAGANARVSINGGEIGETTSARNNVTLSITAGSLTFVQALDFAMVNLSGGSAQSMWSLDDGVLNMTGGTIGGSFYTDDMSTGNIYDGVIFGDVTAYRTSTINIYGGTIQGDIHDFGTVNIHGGSAAGASSFATLAASGGLPDIFAVDDGVVHLFGTGLTQTLVDSNFAYDANGISGNFSKYALTGVLEDGTNIAGTSLFVQNGTGAHFALITTAVPEPDGYLLLGTGFLLVLAAVRRRRCPGQ